MLSPLEATALQKENLKLKEDLNQKLAQLRLAQTELEANKKALEAKESTLKIKDAWIEQLTEELNLARLKQFGRSSEKALTQELLPFDEMPLGVADEPSEATCEVDVPAHIRKLKAGRKALPARLERREVLHDLSEEQKICSCGCTLIRIGEETTEKLALIPRQIYVEKHIRPKYTCKLCAENLGKHPIHLAPLEASVLSRSISTPALLTTILVAKCLDHLPFYRQEAQFERDNIDISRQDMSNWTIKVGAFLEPLLDLAKQKLLGYPVINMDETLLQVLGEYDRENTAKSYMWLARGGPPGEQVVLYEYKQGRGAKPVEQILKDYAGYVQADGWGAYDLAQKSGAFILIACWAHVRRKFDEASKASKKATSALEALGIIRQLYSLEKNLRSDLEAGKLTSAEFTKQRKIKAKPILVKFKTWLDKKQETVLPSSLLGKAVNYTLGQWVKLVRYTLHPDLTPDNNSSERAIRPFVIGRKNWLFSGSPRGALAMCTIYSLLQTAKENGLQPWDYLHQVLLEAPATPLEKWEKFLPFKTFNQQ